MDSVYNNTFVPLNAGQIWEGKSESISKFNVASVSCITDVSSILNLYFSLNNIDFDFVKTYELKPNEPFIINQKVEGKWFKAKVTNNSGVNQSYLRLTTTYKDDVRSDLDIRPLHYEKDTLSIPALEACIVNGQLVCSVENVTVSGVTVDVSGQTVDIEGQTVKSQIYDYNNYAITSQLVGSKRGLDVNNIGTVRAYEGITIKEIGAFTDSHNKVNLQTYDDALNDKINSCDTIGEDTGSIKVYVSNSVNNKVKCDVSGQRMNVNTIEGFTLDTTTQTTNDTLNRILDKGGDIQANIYYTEGASVWADSTPVPTVNVLDPNGWLYTNTNTGNGMNLYYFNGVNEIKTLSQITGQYAVVTNLSTKINNSLIFGIYTKSGSSFFTTRITHSPTNQVNMVAGGRYLLYWGQVNEYIYPNLPRLNFTYVTTTGPANPTEEILSVTLSSDSGAPAGDVKISIEKLGVVFDLESREYNLLGSPTEYETLVNINNKLVVSNNALKVDISGQRVITDISGQRVITDISGQRVVTDISGQRVVTDISGQRVDISGQRVVTDISGQRVVTDISGQYVITDISGQRVVTDISGQRVVTDISGQRVITDISGQRIDISGQRLVVNTITGYATDTLQTAGNTLLADI